MVTTNRLSTLSNGLRALELLDQRAWTMRDLAEACGLPRQTTYRIVATLIDAGWAERDGATYRARRPTSGQHEAPPRSA
ncbi:helix-turn-helix domain-containing protein [Nocardioides sp.]|uniref:helix-turn-helix domain-containing protein n=1 Tax=Nocardioides sp. TaxID=35761 RepID=UPI0035117CDF